jgi:hypothetical protein
MAKTSYEALVAEAFLDPIRSVLIVDDDYPTLHEILLPESERARDYSEKSWHKSSRNRAKVRRVIDQFRRPGAPFMLDIHDGRSPSEETDEQQVGILQQTDLLILDYILDRSKEDDGTASIRIAREALRNKHFNLILVHTNEDLDDIFGNFVLGLLAPCFETETAENVDEPLATFLDEHEAALLNSIDTEQYLAARHLYQRRSTAALNAALQRGAGPLGTVKTILEAGKLTRGAWLRALRYGLEAFEVSREDSFADEDLEVLDWRDEGIKFIRAARGFICFTKKSKEKKNETDLLNAVREALVAWNPLPSRLLLTKLRAEMNERGIEVQDDALGEQDVGAMWYLRLLQQEEPGLQALISRTVRHHSEQLLDQLLPQVNDFASRICEIDAKIDAHDAVKKRFSLDLNNPDILLRAQAGHNAFIGSKPSTNAHVDLGHILLVDGTYWMCATPACDMVPGQDRGSPPDRIPKLKRFTALKLLERKEKRVLEDAHIGGQIFANLQTEHGVERKAFAVAESYGSSPTSITMYVENDGYFSDGEPPQCRVVHVSAREDANGSVVPVLVEHAAIACGMLRYEYALEIQSRYVVSQGRIGLEFEAHKPKDSDEKAE